MKNTPTPEQLRRAFVEVFLKHKTNAEELANFTEKELANFIRRYVDTSFKGVYSELDHNYYDRIIMNIPLNTEMKAANEAAGLRFSSHLKQYSTFLESKQFKQLFKKQIVGANEIKTSKHSAPKFREETEGERKHITKETDIVYRNPQLRQQCLDMYGYQCQCCGMDFVEMYGEELGANFIEVHHLKPISTFEKDGVPENFLENLVPLCSNCHSMIHHIKDGEHTLRDLREAFRGEKKPLNIQKID